jgi:DNA primase
VTIPLDEPQQQARQELQDRFNLTAAVGPRELTKLLEGHSAEDISDAETLLANAKIDVNDFFASGNGKDEFQELLFKACTPVEFGIQGLPEDASEEERNRQLEPVLAEIASHSPPEQSRLLKLVQERLGKAVSMATLKRTGTFCSAEST